MDVSPLLTADTASAAPSLGQRLGEAWGQVVYGVGWFIDNLSPAFFFALVGLALVIGFYVYYWYCLRPRPNSLEWVNMSERRFRQSPMSLTLPRHPMEGGDLVPILVVTVVYAITAFFQLGSFSAPESYTQFQRGDSYSFSFSQPVTVDEISYYTSLGTGSYRLEYTTDGVNWQGVALDQGYNTLFKWNLVDLNASTEGADPIGPITASTFRIVADTVERPEGIWLAELALWGNGEALVPSYVSAGGEALFDEVEEWDTKVTYMNSTYFDEIYHPRTALEHLNNVNPYEVSHPPLGKLIISVGISLFGMVPFGWRFMGTLFGVLMVPILYVFLKNFFGRTAVAFCGTCLFAFDFMHLVQTRIATIDTYGVFFILVSYFFMYRWLSCPTGTPLWKTAPSLFLCGLFWGIGCACKWTVIYAGLGLALLWLLGLIFKSREWKSSRAQRDFVSFAVGTVALSVVFFLLIPGAIYLASYIPYATARGDASLASVAKIMWENQVFMLTYHQGVHTSHPYESYWYQWIFDARPILYYRDLDLATTQGVKSLFASFNNPLVSWLGLLAFFALIIQAVRRRCGKALFILIAILSQFVPWLFIGRILFAYHYFHDAPPTGSRGGDLRLYRMRCGAVCHLLSRPHRPLHAVVVQRGIPALVPQLAPIMSKKVLCAFFDEDAVRCAHNLSSGRGQIPHLRPEKCFSRGACPREKQILLVLRLRAQTLRGFFTDYPIISFFR